MKRLAKWLGTALLLLAIPTQVAARTKPPLDYREIAAPNGGKLLMTIARPQARGGRPAVVILHGTHGFADEYVGLAQELASRGIVGIAVCWFAPGQGKGMRFVKPRACPESTPPLTDGDTTDGQARIRALIQAAANLPGVDSRRLVLMGHSRGAVAALYHALNGGEACGIILNSGAYPPDAVERVNSLAVPILVLHGDADGPTEGGASMTTATRTRDFVRALEQAGKQVDAKFYPEGNHNSLFLKPEQHRQEVSEIVRFMRAKRSCKAPA